MGQLKAKFVKPNSGYTNDIERAKELKLNELYSVEEITMGQSSSNVKLKETDTWFNTIHFEFYKNDELYDIFSDPEYNPYLFTLNNFIRNKEKRNKE